MTKRLNEQLRRNSNWFPNDFAFQLTEEEWGALRSQTATLKTVRGRKRKYLPFAFTEHGALMAADILNSLRAVVMSVYVTPLTGLRRRHPEKTLENGSAIYGWVAVPICLPSPEGAH